MKFGEFPLSELRGGYLAHAIRLGSGLLKKGHVITDSDITALAQNNISHAMVALLEPGDMTEDAAATRIAQHVAGDLVTCANAFTGRANLYAARDGLVTVNASAVDALNHIDEAITLATISQNAIVSKGQMIATVKIIPLAVKGEAIERATADIAPGLITLHRFRPLSATMIQTELNGAGEKIFEKAKRVMSHRLRVFGASLEHEIRCPHQEKALADALITQTDGDHDIILIMGASAITDRRDVIPAAIERAGGDVIHYGMPVDPGNLLLLAKLSGKWVLGLPGCSRSPKLNGIDLILSRIAAGQQMTRDHVMNMGVGGLLSEYAGRPQPRDPRALKRTGNMTRQKNIAALVLAAGQSKRMGQENKLLLPYQGQAVLCHVLEQVQKAGIRDIFVVTGHQKQEVEQEIGRYGVRAVHNDLYQEGMSGSVKLGIQSLPKDVDGVIIILGDMPTISGDILKKLLAAYNPAEGRSIIIPKHNGKRGNPILWDRELFSEFERLKGDMGAKLLLNEFPEFIHEVDIGSDAIFLDIDTFEAYERLRHNMPQDS